MLIYDIGLVIITASLIGILARLLKQPLIPAYIFAGIILGPLTGLITDSKNISLLAEIGITFMLFIVGMELDLKKLREVGTIAILGGLLSSLILFFSGFFIASFFSENLFIKIYSGLLVALSSTMVVVKILSDRKELDTLHSRIIIGYLLFQDLIAVLALSLLNNLNEGFINSFLRTIILGSILFLTSILLSKLFFPKLFQWIAKSQELLFLIGIAICFFFAFIFYQAGLSMAIGSFVAGIIIGSLPYHIEIISKVSPIKDFFSVLFFVAVGLQLTSLELNYFFLLLLLANIILVPLVFMIITILFGYKSRTSFLTGLSLAQTSEFSLILASFGLTKNQINNHFFNIIILITLLTIALTSYLLKYENKIYYLLRPLLKPLEALSKKNKILENISDEHKHKVILVGYNRTGYSIFKTLKKLKKDFVVVDYNPEVIKKLALEGTPCIYGDIGDIEVLEKLKLEETELIISTADDINSNKLLISIVKKKNPKAIVIVSASNADDALELYEEGADYVIIPHYLSGERVSIILEEVSDNLQRLLEHKIKHVKELHLRKHFYNHKKINL